MRRLRIVLFLFAAVLGGLALYGVHVFRAALPQLEGQHALAGLAGPVTIERDPAGVPTITAANRIDLARALGFVHAQERFFGMDLLRRAGAGELAALVGPAALPADRERRLHRFRADAAAMLAAMGPDERALLRAYTDGVNAGLAALGRAPWEYTLLRVSPAPWTDADSVLVTDAMYFDLQADGPTGALQREAAIRVLGPAMAAFVLPDATDRDAPIDGTVVPEPPIPDAGPASAPAGAPAPVTAPERGSNNFAVAGRLTATGAAMLETDMHLSLRIPHIWFRARLRVPGSLDLIGVTLPGEPTLIAGSNGHVAWGFTNTYAETGDAIRLAMLPGSPEQYRTPDGARTIETSHERICAAHGACEDLPVRETVWGPVAAEAQGPIVWRWVAHQPGAVRMAGLAALERAQNVTEALAAARLGGVPAQNAVLTDSAGHIAWTVMGALPGRASPGPRVPEDWSAQAAWTALRDPATVPVVQDPPSGRLWTANARVVGGAALTVLGDGGYAWSVRASRIAHLLAARDRFAEPDMLAIATDDRAEALDPWQKLLLAAIAARPADGTAQAMRPYVEQWQGRAEPGSIGYRLVRAWQRDATGQIYGALTAPLTAALHTDVEARAAPRVAERVLEAPAPGPLPNREALAGTALTELEAAVANAPGGLPHFTWGALNRTAIVHPLAKAVPLLGLLTNAPDEPVAGDTIVPRVAVPGFGASERLVVSPGHEATGIFEMPAGQSDNPLSPYYLAGHEDWVAGKPAPLLPGPTVWRMLLAPQ